MICYKKISLSSAMINPPVSFSFPFRAAPTAVAISVFLLVSGCAVTPQPLLQSELEQITASDRLIGRQNQVALNGAVSLEEAIARALKYNLDHRTRLLEQSLASGQLEAGRYDMLPKLLANAGYATRDSDNTRRSSDPLNPGTFSSDAPYISSENDHATGDLGLSWSLLDFGASYYSAKQNGDRLLIASEMRRKSMHALIQNVRTAYWRALAAQALGERVQEQIKLAEGALSDAVKLSNARVRALADTLRYRRNLLENLRLLEGLERELASARIELASLIGAQPGDRFELVEPQDSLPEALTLPVENMEALALSRNADLRASFYNVRIAADDTRKALLRLMPGISFDSALKYDSDKFLVNQKWQEAGVRVSFNLLNLLSGPSQMRAAELGETVFESRRMALQMNVLTQVHLVRHQYDDALRQYLRAEAISEVDTGLAALADSATQSQMASPMEGISANVTALLSAARRYQSMAKLHEAASKVQATLGVEPEIGSLDDTDLPTLQQSIAKSLKGWAVQ